LTLLDGAITFPLQLGDYQRSLLQGQEPASAALVKRRDGNYYLQVAVEVPTQEPSNTPQVKGVDLGCRDIAPLARAKRGMANACRPFATALLGSIDPVVEGGARNAHLSGNCLNRGASKVSDQAGALEHGRVALWRCGERTVAVIAKPSRIQVSPVTNGALREAMGAVGRV